MNRYKKLFFLSILLLIMAAGIGSYSASRFSEVKDRNYKELQLIDKNMKSFCFAVFGDNRNSMEAFRTLTNSVNSDGDIMFSIDIGDLVHDGEKRKYMLFIRQIEDFRKPVLTAVGNHDILNHGRDNGRKNYYSFLGNFYYSFAVGEAYFIVLDEADERNRGLQQMQWLKEELEKSIRYRYRFVFMHIPLFDPRVEPPAAGHAMSNIKHANELNALFDKYNITMLFTSHIHSFYRGIWNHTPYIITGGAGAQLYGTSPEHSFYHYVKTCVSEKGITYEVEKFKPRDLRVADTVIRKIHDAAEYAYTFLSSIF